MQPTTNGTDEVKERVQELLAQMTREEKADLLTGVDMWHFKSVERLGVKSMRVTDCGHGVTLTGDPRNLNGTCFPTAVGQASTWNYDLIRRQGEAMGEEVRGLGYSMLLGPMVNLHRFPLGGRNYETYSEDPYLAGRMAAALIEGIQSRGPGACIKGFTANNQQAEQTTTSAEIDERTLREIYCPAFRIPVQGAHPPYAIMTSYNLLNGEHTSENAHLIRDIIKRDWAYEGVVLSDWRGVHTTDAIAAGLDLEMPGPGKYLTKENVLQAIEDGVIDDAELDDRAGRILGMILRSTREDAPEGEVDSPAHRSLAREVAEEAIVLLKNDDVLPFSTGLKSLAVIGPNAEQARLGGGGSASVAPPYSVGVLDGIIDQCGGEVEVRYAEGCASVGALGVLTNDCIRAGDSPDGEPGFLAEFFANETCEGEPAATTVQRQVDFSWGWAAPAAGMPRGGYSVRWSGCLVPRESGSHRLGVAGHGRFRLCVDGEPWIDEWETGGGEHGVPEHTVVSRELDLTAGEPVNLRLEYAKTGNPASARLEWCEPGAPDPVDAAAEAARGADAAIVCVGLSNSHEGGLLDRKGLALPGEQDRLVQAVAGANPNTVVVIIGGNPVRVSPWIDQVAAVLEAWYPGQEGGNAVARVLFGDVNPSGRLPDTFPRRLEDTPAHGNYPGDGVKVHYREGVFVGYRHYLSKDVEPQFPFGFGLSYTTFEYGDVSLSADTLSADGTLTASVDVTNTGERAGKEVVQLYVRDVESSVPRPLRELKGFEKVEIQPGETRTVSFAVTPDDLAFYDVESCSWLAEPGTFELMLGRSCADGSTARFAYLG